MVSSTGSFTRTDLYSINHVVQNTHLSYCQELVVGLLRDQFSQDSYYHFVQDEWGYCKAPDHTGLPLGAGYADDVTTRLFIGRKFHFDTIFYPALLITGGNFTSRPLSFNRNRETVRSEAIKVIDGYGNSQIFTRPSHFVFAGCWDGSINVEVHTRDVHSRDHLVETCKLLFEDILHDEFLRAGVLIKKVSGGTPSEGDDRQQDKLYKQTLTLDIYTEWRREIPVDNIVDAINICVDFVDVRQNPPTNVSPNLSVRTTVQLIDEVDSL